MHAYALLGTVDPAFGTHNWALNNVVANAYEDDFSTIWSDPRAVCELTNYNDAVYLYGGRKKIYQLLQNFRFAKIKHAVKSHPNDLIHVFREEFEVDGIPPFAKDKHIFMFAVADAQRLAQLAQWRDTDLAVDSFDKVYGGNDIMTKMEKKWPGRLLG